MHPSLHRRYLVGRAIEAPELHDAADKVQRDEGEAQHPAVEELLVPALPDAARRELELEQQRQPVQYLAHRSDGVDTPEGMPRVIKRLESHAVLA